MPDATTTTPDVIPTVPAREAEIDRLERRLKTPWRLLRAVKDAAEGGAQ